MPAVKPPVSDVVDGRRVGAAGVMSDAEGEVAECKALVVTDEAEDHAELAVRRWQVGLEAGRELRAVAVLGIAGAQGLDLCAVTLEPPARLTQRLGSRAAAPHRVLGEGALAEKDASMTPPDGHGLPLAVCGQKRPVLGL